MKPAERLPPTKAATAKRCPAWPCIHSYVNLLINPVVNMKRPTIKLTIALLAFLIGIAVVAVWPVRGPSRLVLKEAPCRLDNDIVPPLTSQIIFYLDRHHVPSDLQERLAQRIFLFTKCQRAESWGEVARMLGDVDWNREAFTTERKRAFIESMKEKPMISFTPQCLTYSTEIMDKPLEEKWWGIHGKAHFYERGETDATILAYLDNGEWYFTPTGGMFNCGATKSEP